jgi:hypothetical protein
MYSRLWLVVVVCCCVTQRATLSLGIHPEIVPTEAIVYMNCWTVALVLFHLLAVDFTYRVVIECSIFLSLSTAGWRGEASWTTAGQPVDTAMIGVPVLVGEAIGYAFQHMARKSFLDRAAAQAAAVTAAAASTTRSPSHSWAGVDAPEELERAASTHRLESLGLIGRGASADILLVRQARAPPSSTTLHHPPATATARPRSPRSIHTLTSAALPGRAATAPTRAPRTRSSASRSAASPTRSSRGSRASGTSCRCAH